MRLVPIDKDAQEIIERHKYQNNVWFIDVQGDNGWMSGNIMDKGDCGYGGFYTYKQAKKLFDEFENIARYTPEDLDNYHSEGEEEFKPKAVYIGYYPIRDDKEGAFVAVKELK